MKQTIRDEATADYAQYVTYRISQINSRMISQGSQVLRKQCGLSVVKWRLIALVAGASEPVTSSQLANTIEMDPGQFSRNLKVLIDEGLITRKLDKSDNRQHVLTLSKAGRTRFNQIEPVMKRRREALMNGISPDEQKAFFRVLRQLEKNIQTQLSEEAYA